MRNRHNIFPAETDLYYDNFANSLERLRLEIYALKNQLEGLLFNRDPLTLAINRITMLPVLREQQELTKRKFQTCCIAMVDIDHFKKVNDEFGHAIGDRVLASLARYLIENIRPYDKLFRYGGEEFLICMQQVSLSEALDRIEHIRQGVASMPFNVCLEKPLYITVSCGVTILNPDTTVEQSIDYADKALYLAKSSGRNQTQVSKSDILRKE